MHEIIYFNSPGLAESSRLCLELSGISWKDTTVDNEEYIKLKNDNVLPYDLLPIIRTSQGIIAESTALLRYTGALAGLEPEDLFMRAKVDEIIDVMRGWWESFTPTFYIEDMDEKINARKNLFEEGGKLNIGLKILSALYEDSDTGWLVNTEFMSIADIKLFTDVFMLFSGQFDGLDKSIILNYPTLLKFHNKMSNVPEIKLYYSEKKESNNYWVYYPNSFDN
jgi:hypothetical protein